MTWDLILQQTVNGVAHGMSLALIALGLTMVFGVLHIINFAHGELYMIGGLGLVIGMTHFHLGYVPSLALAIVAAGAIAWLVDGVGVRPLLDQKDGHSTVLLTTFAISMLLNEGALAIWGPSPVRVDGFEGLTSFGPIVVTNQRWFVIGLGLVVLIAIEFILRRTHIGKSVRAIASSAYAAEVVGVNVRKVRTITFVAAGALAGLTGGVMVPITMFTPSIGHNIIIDAFVVVVVGGMGSATGAVVCGLLVGLAQAYLSTLTSEQIGSAMVYGLLLITLLVRPTGLTGRGRA